MMIKRWPLVLALLALRFCVFAQDASAIYSPTLGRFVSRDLAGYGDGENLYQMTRSSPLKRIDPSGFASFDGLEACLKYKDSIWSGLKPKCAANGWTISLSCQASRNGTGRGLTTCSSAGWLFGNNHISVTLYYDVFVSEADMAQTIAHELQHASDFCTCGNGCNLTRENTDGKTTEDTCANIFCTEIRAILTSKACDGLGSPEARERCLKKKLVPYWGKYSKWCSEGSFDKAYANCIFPEGQIDPPWPL